MIKRLLDSSQTFRLIIYTEVSLEYLEAGGAHWLTDDTAEISKESAECFEASQPDFYKSQGTTCHGVWDGPARNFSPVKPWSEEVSLDINLLKLDPRSAQCHYNIPGEPWIAANSLCWMAWWYCMPCLFVSTGRRFASRNSRMQRSLVPEQKTRFLWLLYKWCELRG